MASGGPLTPLGLVLQLQGGTAQKQLSSVFGEKLPVIKALAGGQINADMLKGLLGNGGLSSIMQNPLSGITDVAGQLVSQVQGLIGQVGSMAGQQADSSPDGATPATQAYPLTLAALQSLSTAASDLLAGVQGLAGTGAPAPYGPIDLVLHATSVGNIGDVFPPLSYVAAEYPLTPAAVAAVRNAQQMALDACATILRYQPTLSDQAVAASIDVAAADVGAVMGGSTAAIGGLRDALTTVALAQAIGAATVSADPGAYGTTPATTALLDTLKQIVQPGALATLETQARAEYYVEPIVWTEAAPTINMNNVAVQQWVKAYSTQTGTPEAVEVI